MDETLEQWNFRPVQAEEKPFGELDLSVAQQDDGIISLKLTYDTALYPQEEIETVAQVLGSILQSMAEHPETTLERLPLVAHEEQQSLVKLGTGEKRDYDTTKTLIDLFREQAVKTPDAVAVLDIDSQFTYSELDQKSDVLVCLLIEEGVKPGDHVCVELPRKKEFMLAAFGIMKAGAAYVPIDMEYPEGRKRFIIDDSEAKLVIDEAWLKTQAGRLSQDMSSHQPSAFCLQPSSTAYIIYTSGSTGKPKGVVVPHRALSHFVQFIADEWKLMSESRISNCYSFAFDASIENIFPVLTVGGTTCIVPTETSRDLQLLHKFILDNSITGGTYSTQLGQLLLQEYPNLPVDYLVVGGERMMVKPDCSCRLINIYGPTEFTVGSTYYELEPSRQYYNIPIGRPLPNQTAYIIDRDKRLLPQGMAGELCLAGIQMSTGYWKREELTKELFTDIIVDGNRVIVYRTGDLCRWNEEGQLEYLGRIDQQVKLRGFRIELGEIESQALKFEGISQAVATVHNGELLCLYYTADFDKDEGALKEFLARSLPDYMVPSAYIQLDVIPLTPNGKVDRRRLNELNKPLPSADIHQVSPCNKMEKTLLDIAHEVLGREDFGVTDNLKLFGMNSIQAMRIAIQARQKGYTIRVAELIKYQTIRHLHPDGISMSRWLNVRDKEKPIVVFTLGISGEPNSSHLLQALQERYRVFLFENLTEIYTTLTNKNVDLLMDDYLSILHKELNGEGIHAFIGHSFGGEMAYRLAGRWSELSGRKAHVVVLDNAPWTDSKENSWKLLKDMFDEKQYVLPKSASDKLDMAILIDDIVTQMRVASDVCPCYNLPVHLFVSTNRSYADDVLDNAKDILTAEERKKLHEILDADDKTNALDVEGIWHKNHKGTLKVSHIPNTHMGMLKKEYSSIYMDSLTL